MINRFRPYNKSLLVNVFMSNEYKDIWNKWYIPKYNEINNVNKYNTALMWAYKNNRANIVKLLLAHPDINVNSQNCYSETALMWACSYINLHANIKTIKLLLKHPRININIRAWNNQTALDWAMLENNKELINLLQSHGAQ